jgi:4-amino-4-deoxy-L-arabinose transferase-like glycosyltransferase
VDETNNANETIQTEPGKAETNRAGRALVDLNIDLAANERIDISIHILPDEGAEPVVQVGSAHPRPPAARTIRLPKLPALSLPRLSLQQTAIDARMLFGAALGVYLILQFVQLPSFPIYFFCDEAVNPVLASDFIRDSFHNYDGVFFPTFFKNGGQYNLGTSVYLQLLPYALFGKAIWVTRGFFVLISAMTAIFSALILRDFFKSRYWWSAPLWLAATPIWFLHARAALENAPVVAFYAGFLYFYLRYRTNQPNRLYLSLVFGALAFYTYTPAQLIVVITGFLLLISDWRYHVKHWRTGMRGAALLLVLAAPLVRFWMMMPDEYSNRLSMYGSYWAADISTLEKLGNYLRIYLSGLNPRYWFFPHGFDNPLHTMKGYGHFGWLMLPPFALGLWKALRGWKAVEMRVMLAALLAAPTGTAMAALHPNRALPIVIPVIVLGLVGFEAGAAWIRQQKPVREGVFGFGMAALLTFFSVFMTVDALKNGPTWYSNYGLSGMQWGARQVYSAAKGYIREYPDRTLYISPNWTFQAEVVREFFAPGERQIRVGTTDASIQSVDSKLGEKAFVLMAEEYERVKSSGRFQEPQIDEIIPYPDGRPGFYFVRLAYLDNMEEIIRAEQEERQRIHQSEVAIGDLDVIVRHTAIEGDLNSLFDGSPDTLIKTRGINPLVVGLEFPTPVRLSGITARVGSEPVKITVVTQGEEKEREYSVQMGAMGPYKNVPIVFSEIEKISSLRFTLQDIDEPETSYVHLWEITLDFAP